MSQKSRSRRYVTPRWRAGLAGASLLAVVAAAVPTTSGSAAPTTEAVECPTAIPVSDVLPGMPVSRLTVSHGTTPDTITGEIVGVIPNGIAPGMDLIVAQMAGSEITDPGTDDVWRGIWAGMSGSPVYAPDGRLVGAVSYGFSWSPSDYAGITPAEDMYAVRDYPGITGQASRTVDVTARVARRMKADGVSQQQVDAGFHRLRLPITVSGGLSNQRLHRLAERYGQDAALLPSGDGASADEGPTPIEPGGNLAASLSYGDMSQIGTGTATAICNDAVLGFGHPMLFTGKSKLTMHGAEALFVETDIFDGSYKIANPTAPVGRITQDRLAGILGVPGSTPDGTEITSRVTGAGGGEREGSTTMTAAMETPPNVPYVAALHLVVNQDAMYDRVGPGAALAGWTVRLRLPDGSTREYTRRDVYASRYDLSTTTADSLYFELWWLLDSGFKSRIAAVDEVAKLRDDDFHAYQLDRVQRRVGGVWYDLDPDSTVRARASSTMVLRARIIPRDDSIGKTTWVPLKAPVGSSLDGRSGRLVISGGASTSNPVRVGESLPQLLEHLSKDPRNDRVYATLNINRPSGHGPVARVPSRLLTYEVHSGSRSTSPARQDVSPRFSKS